MDTLKTLRSNGLINSMKETWDISHIKAPYIIEIIDEAFVQWKNNPWSKNYSFDTFCEYILPYRNNDEPLNKGWQKKYRATFGEFKKNINDETDPLDVCNAVLLEMKHFEFVQLQTYPQPLYSAEQLLFRRKGSCPNLAHAAVLGTRVFGLAVTFDFTPFFAASSSGHFWNTIVDANGIHIPFNGTDNGHLAIENGKRMGKVLRNTFSKNNKALASFMPPKFIPYFKLEQKNMIDVTDEYINTSNITYTYSSPIKYQTAYIMAYNYGEWKALWWGKTDAENNAVFKNMGRNIVYLPAQLNLRAQKATSNNLIKESHPILLKIDGTQQLLQPNFTRTIDCNLTRDNELTLTYQDFNTVELTNGEKFKLSYWDNGWQLIGIQLVKNNSITFKGLPTNALFQLLPENPDQFERNFIIEPSNCQIQWF